MKKIIFFDTTLRDGEQMPGVHLSFGHKLEIARQLEQLGVDVIEAGFPASSKGNFNCVKEIARTVKSSVVCALARAASSDIDMAWAAIKDAVHPRIHVFIATSDIHMKYKLKMSREQVLCQISDMVSYARKLCPDVEFSAEDAGRSDRDFLCRALEAAIEAGAQTVNIPDTVGYNLPPEFGLLIKYVKENVKNIDRAVISVHCHNDLGNAVANSLSAIENGALQIECTVNGTGERAGNAALEEIVMALHTRYDYYQAETNIDTVRIGRTSRMVSSLFGITLPPNKAVVGSNAFSHESGIHQHGMLADRRTYEIMSPESVGLGSSFILGNQSGRHAFAERVSELGYSLDDKSLECCFAAFKRYADKKEISDDDIMAIINEYLDNLENIYELDTFQIQSGNKTRSMAMVSLACRGTSLSEAALGDGPIDAAFNAVNRLSGAVEITLEEYRIKAITEGADALGEAMVKVRIDGAGYSGRSVSPDIIEASIKAYINAINKWAAKGKQTE